MKRILGYVLAVTLVQLVLFAPFILLAGTISRSTKAGSTTQFSESFALGNTLAVADLDTDLNSAYSTINGSIDSSNISDGTITTDDIASGTIVNANISGSAAIAGSKLGVGAGSRQLVSAVCNTNLTIGAVETTAATVTITSGGGMIVLNAGCVLSAITTTTGSTITVAWKRDGVAQIASNYSVNGGSASVGPTFPLPIPTLIQQPSAGTYSYTLTVVVSGTTTVTTPSGNQGVAFALELR